MLTWKAVSLGPDLAGNHPSRLPPSPTSSWVLRVTCPLRTNPISEPDSRGPALGRRHGLPEQPILGTGPGQQLCCWGRVGRSGRRPAGLRGGGGRAVGRCPREGPRRVEAAGSGGRGRQPAPEPALTGWEPSLLLSRDRVLASRFFFLCNGLDSRIISSSSKVGSQCRRPFWGAGRGGLTCGPAPGLALPPWPRRPAVPQAYVGHKTRLHLLLEQVVPQHVGQRGRGLHVLEAGDAVLGVHSEELEGVHVRRGCPGALRDAAQRPPREEPPRPKARGRDVQGLRGQAANPDSAGAPPGEGLGCVRGPAEPGARGGRGRSAETRQQVAPSAWPTAGWPPDRSYGPPSPRRPWACTCVGQGFPRCGAPSALPTRASESRGPTWEPPGQVRAAPLRAKARVRGPIRHGRGSGCLATTPGPEVSRQGQACPGGPGGPGLRTGSRGAPPVQRPPTPGPEGPLSISEALRVGSCGVRGAQGPQPRPARGQQAGVALWPIPDGSGPWGPQGVSGFFRFPRGWLPTCWRGAGAEGLEPSVAAPHDRPPAPGTGEPHSANSSAPGLGVRPGARG